MKKTDIKTKNKKEITVTTEIKEHKNGTKIFTLDYTFFKVLNCYNLKKLYYCLYVEATEDKKIIKHVLLTSKKPDIEDSLIFLQPVKMQLSTSGSKSPRLAISTILKFFCFLRKKTHITITSYNEFIAKKKIKNAVYLEFN